MESFPKALKGNIRTVYLDFKIKKKKKGRKERTEERREEKSIAKEKLQRMALARKGSKTQ